MHLLTFNYPLQYSKELGNINAKKQLCVQLLSESLNGKCEYPTQPKGSFQCHVIDTKGIILDIYKGICISVVPFFLNQVSGKVKAASESQE